MLTWTDNMARSHCRSTNNYGYQYHFDIQTTNPVLGDNPVVNFEQVSCPSQAVTDYKQCQCAK
jgi:hypothetical protein